MLDNSAIRCLKSRAIRTFIVLVSMGLLSACASSVVVKSEIPSPLVERLPINTTIIYTDHLKNYSYNEPEKKRALTSLEFGQAQVDMFEKVFGALLNVVELNSREKELLIEPEILDFQYTVPSETKLNLYEVWIKYRIKLMGADNTKLADWTIKGYGKTPTALLTSPATAFNAATNVALRDVGAQLSLYMPTQLSIKKILTDNLAKRVSTEVDSATVTKSIPSDSIVERSAGSLESAKKQEGL